MFTHIKENMLILDFSKLLISQLTMKLLGKSKSCLIIRTGKLCGRVQIFGNDVNKSKFYSERN